MDNHRWEDAMEYVFREYETYHNNYDEYEAKMPPRNDTSVIDLIFEDGVFQVPTEKPRLGCL